MLLIVFGSTLFLKPNIIFRFATLADKSIAGSSYENQVRLYCKKVTIVWCCFFILNGTAAALTTFADKLFGLDQEQARRVWAVYNGGISYALMGIVPMVLSPVVLKKCAALLRLMEQMSLSFTVKITGIFFVPLWHFYSVRRQHTLHKI